MSGRSGEPGPPPDAVARSRRRQRNITLAMGAVAFVALAGLFIEYGFPDPRHTAIWHEVQTNCALLFILLQCARPAVSLNPFRHLREHRLDYALMFLLVFGLVAAASLQNSPEFRYLAGHGAAESLDAINVLAIQCYLVFLVILKSPWFHRALLALPFGAITALWTSFAALIGLSTLLLMTPGAAAPGRSVTWVQALFTATSAACVTGLSVVDTGTHWSPFGQGVILATIQLGGLGILTLTGSVALLGGGPLGSRERRSLAEISETDALPQVRAALVRPLMLTALIEAAGALLLFRTWWNPDGHVMRQVWQAIFHSVSAFCNAGFSLFSDQLAGYRDDPLTLGIIAALIVAGGLGFGTLWDLIRVRLTAQSRAALLSIAVLIPAGGLGIWVLERDRALAACPEGTRLLNALFLSVSSRTAGFQTTDLGGLTLAGSALIIVLMLIGGAPGSTAGGIKTTTFWAIAARHQAAAYRRRALAVAVAVPAVFTAAGVLISWITAAAIGGIWFESASAVGTVGLSRGITASLPPAAHLVLVAAMFFGRVGPFIIAFALRRQDRRAGVAVSHEPYLIG